MAKDLTQGAIAPWLYRLTAPMVLGIMAMFLFNLVDTYFISLLGTQPLAAISFTFPVTMLVINMGIGLSIATGAVVARALGQKDQQQTTLWISSSFYLAILIALVLMTVGLTFQDAIFQLLGAGPELLPLISAYMNWWFAGSVLLIILIVVNASVRATGNTKLPSLVMLFSALLNGILLARFPNWALKAPPSPRSFPGYWPCC